jgi:hypothetical protein
MKPFSQLPRTPCRLPDSVHRQLNMYALAASAAGVGALALVQPAGARIIYTPANRVIGDGSVLDLNHNHRVDFRFHSQFHILASSSSSQLSVFPVGTNNRIWGTGQYAAALGTGVRIESSIKKLRREHDLMGRWIWTYGSAYALGQWPYVKQGYLGLKFYVKGKAHYGWARLSMSSRGYPWATLTGYAYETIPNRPIITGKTKGPDVITLEPGSLGRLAEGSARR